MPSRNLQITVAWILLASLIMGIALWQAQVVVAREAASQHKNLPPPTNTRHAIRAGPATADIDPVADYIARCEKGMTVQEIRWVLTDFENAGLAGGKTSDEMTEAEAAAYHKAQRHWYLRCLAQGLNLSSEQKKEASDMMVKLARETYRSHLEYLKNGKETGEQPLPDHTITIEGIDLKFLNLTMGHEFGRSKALQSWLPWKFCKLTPPQASLTWKYGHDIAFPDQSNPNRIDVTLDQPELSDPHQLAKKTGGPVFHVSNPINNSSIGIPIWLNAANKIHPLLATQKLADNSDNPDAFFEEMDPKKFIPQLRALHPVQLKMALLLDADISGKIREALESCGF
ncbi:hypothetical protein GCM10023212_08630 [Luteolibacter yonseiensis]